MADEITPSGATYRLEVDAVPGSLATARLFAGAVARALDMTDEDINDVKLAVSEAVTAIVEAGRVDRVAIEIDPRVPTLLVGPVTEADLPEESDAYTIISALFVGARLDGSAGQLIVQLRPTGGAVDRV